ncbi:MAG TPA: coproporphyrinogen III oxidase, partial [Anaeromyxobacteraceae bacterium]|nr:coproporphyrinogen III oxidase [Anaeromyxobacteraceae bacterium]
ALTLDPEVLAEDVPLARAKRAGRLEFPPDAEVLAQAHAIRVALRRAGLRRYEISNFARVGFESAHNRVYWASQSYLGLGCGAFGCLYGDSHALRWGNHRAPAAYLSAVEAGLLPSAEEERLGPRELADERLMLALRTTAGLALSELAPSRQSEVRALVHAHLAALLGDRLVLTARGMDVHSAVVERLMPT